MTAPTVDGSNSYGSSANAASHTVPLPTTGMAEGKPLVTWIETGGGAATPVTCSGWTVVGGGDEAWNTPGSVTMRLAYKYAGASESDPTFDVGASNLPFAAVIHVIGGADPIAAFEDMDAFENNDGSSLTSVIIPALTTLGPDRLILRMAAHSNASDTTWPAGDSEIVEATTSGTLRGLSAASALQALAGSTGTSEPTIASAGQMGGAAVAIAPAAGVVVPPYFQHPDDSGLTGKKRRVQNWLI